MDIVLNPLVLDEEGIGGLITKDMEEKLCKTRSMRQFLFAAIRPDVSGSAGKKGN